jgi:outer membrane cobalamin receptor
MGVSFDCPRLQVSINYVYLHAFEFNVDGDDVIEGWRAHSPRHKVDYSVQVQTDFGLGIAHFGQVIIDRVDSDQTGMPDYYLAHVKATYRVVRGADLFANVRNLFDVNYEEERYYPMPGRQVMVGVDASL